MPGITEFEQFAKSYTLAIGLLVVACITLACAVVRLYRENQRLYAGLTRVLEERVKTLEAVMEDRCVRNHS